MASNLENVGARAEKRHIFVVLRHYGRIRSIQYSPLKSKTHRMQAQYLPPADFSKFEELPSDSLVGRKTMNIELLPSVKATF